MQRGRKLGSRGPIKKKVEHRPGKFGPWLRLLRQGKFLKAIGVATAIGLDSASYRKIEQGIRWPEPRQIAPMGKILWLNAKWLACRFLYDKWSVEASEYGVTIDEVVENGTKDKDE